MIIKFQQGGLAPLVSYQPVTVTGGTPSQAQTASSSQAKSGNDLTDDDLLKMLDKLDGLPSDMSVLINKLQNFYIDQKYSPDTSSIASRYLQLMGDLKIANRNKAEYDKAFEIVSKNGGLNEYAISDRGQLFCINSEGDFKLLSIDQLNENSDYTPLTNSELLYYRAEHPDMANKNNILKVVSNGIGMETVTKMIKDSISNLGTTDLSTEGYSQIQNKQIISGINILKEAAVRGAFSQDFLTVDGLYKNEIITKSQAQQASMAIAYLKSALPKNAWTLLKVKSDGTDKGAESLLNSLIGSNLDSTVTFNTELQEKLNVDGSTKSAKEIDDKSKINPAIAFQLDMGVETTLPIIAGSTDSLILQAYRMPVTTKEGNPLGVTTLDKVSNTSALGGIFDFSHVTMGDQVLDMSSSKNIVVDGSSIFKVYLPYDQTKAAQGIITPNLNYLALLEKVRKEVKERGATTPEEINAVYEENNLPQFLTLDGKVNEQFYKPFGVLNATALSDAFPKSTDLDNNINFEEVDDDNIINNYWEIIKGKDSKESFDSKGWFELDYQQMWKGLVYLPLNSTDPTLGAYSGGDTPSYSTVADYRARWQQDQRIQDYKPQGQLQL